MIPLKNYCILFLLGFTLFTANKGMSQSCDFNFTSVENTGVNMIILVHSEALENEILNVGDSLGAFIQLEDQWVCVGSIVWDGNQQTLVVWGDDTFTPEQEAMLPFQQINLYAQSNDVIYQVDYQPTMEYITNDVKIIDSALSLSPYCSPSIQIQGCTDSTYIEYNAFALIDDGSCMYSIDFFSSPDEEVLSETNSSMSVLFPAGVLNGYEEMIIQAFVAGEKVSEAEWITSLGMAGLNVVGTDENCECLLANTSDTIEFAIYDEANQAVYPLITEIPILYQANGMESVNSISIHSPIVLQLANGWNMVGYTGNEITPIDEAMPLNFHEDFFLIKDVYGNFWNELVDVLGVFEPGNGYMMYAYIENPPPVLQFSQVYHSDINFQFSTGWNMVAFTGTQTTTIEEAMPANFDETFFLIKDVYGNFWNELVDVLEVFEPGKAYMMYVYQEAIPPALDFTD